MFVLTLQKNIYNMIFDEIHQSFQEIFTKTTRTVLVVHSNPDGDALGSALALSAVLNGKGHPTQVVIPNMYPSFLAWMPHLEEAIVFEGNAPEARKALQEAELVFCLDFNHFKRAGTLHSDLEKLQVPVAMIDHHVEPNIEAFTYVYSDIKVSSTAELVYSFIKGMNWLDAINEEVASCLYVGIMTDTGSFSYALKNPNTFHIVAELVNKGIDAERLHRMVYDTFSEHRLRLLGHAISNKMMILDSCKAAIITLTLNDLNDFNFQIGDTEGIVNVPLSMEAINFAVLITEKKDQVRLSFRSKGSFSVNDFARKHFEGGGHFNAAGGSSALNLKDTISKLLKTIQEHCEELNYTY